MPVPKRSATVQGGPCSVRASLPHAKGRIVCKPGAGTRFLMLF